LTGVVPALKINGVYVTNPLVHTQWSDNLGNILFGESRKGEDLAASKTYMKQGEVCLDLLDEAVEGLATKLMMTMPGCLMKTIGSVRKFKLEHWDRNKETNRQWLGLNMMTEARLGFRAFNEGPRNQREVDFIQLRRRLAEGETWNEQFIDSLIPREVATAVE